MKFKTFLVCSFFFLSSLCGYIVETPHFKDLEKYASHNSLIVLDIDDTLLIPAQTLGNDVWFRYRLEKHKKEGKAPAQALALAVEEWEGVRHLTKMNLVEKDTDTIVASLQDKGYSIIGLTTQAHSLAACTVQQLATNNIDLSRTAPSKNDHYFINKLGNLFHKGILFTSGTPKGPSLLKLLDHLEISPQTVVFINDKAEHLLEVKNALQQRGIDFIGLRYSFCDERIQNFNKDIAEIQWKHSTFERILSDEEASLLLKTNHK